jgi:rRNA-processing protein FCF1
LLQVVIDSSFLIAVMERPTTWYEDIVLQVGSFEIVILSCVEQELVKLAKKGSRVGKFARLAVDLCRSFNHAQSGEGEVDSEIISYARTHHAAVASIDRELIARAKAAKIKVLTLRRGRLNLG